MVSKSSKSPNGEAAKVSAADKFVTMETDNDEMFNDRQKSAYFGDANQYLSQSISKMSNAQMAPNANRLSRS